MSGMNLTNHFLIAMPGMLDDAFAQSVIYICEHNEHGALGLVINKPTDVTLEQLFNKVDLTLNDLRLLNQAVYYGGPVQTERGFVLHDQPRKEENTPGYTASLQVPCGLEMTSSKDILEEIAQGRGPEHFLITLGYAGWDAGQLELEISRNGWLSVVANADIIFRTPAGDRYNQALALLGVRAGSLVGNVGHA